MVYAEPVEPIYVQESEPDFDDFEEDFADYDEGTITAITNDKKQEAPQYMYQQPKFYKAPQDDWRTLRQEVDW